MDGFNCHFPPFPSFPSLPPSLPFLTFLLPFSYLPPTSPHAPLLPTPSLSLSTLSLFSSCPLYLPSPLSSVPSSQLLDSFTIACVMVLSFIFLRTRYKVINFMGVLLSLIGIISLVLADLELSHLNQGRTACNLSNTV